MARRTHLQIAEARRQARRDRTRAGNIAAIFLLIVLTLTAFAVVAIAQTLSH